MKKLYLLILALSVQSSFGQIVFWSENFITSTCGSGTLANGYATPNGTWTVASTGTNDPEANLFYISAKENGNGTGQCGTACGTNRTLHVGANDGFSPIDGGASYDAGGLCPTFFCVISNWRAQSPVINCSGSVSVRVSFNYMEFGDNSIDDATFWYYDGATWAQIDALAKTPCCGGPCNGNRQGQWTYYSVSLPSSANNNPNVKIGFNWTNNDDGAGTDPSFAVDDITVEGLAVSVSEISSSSVLIYPNPAKDELTISLSNSKPGTHYTICDISGRKVREVGMIITSEEKINVADLSTGFYFVHLFDSSNKTIASSRFIKE